MYKHRKKDERLQTETEHCIRLFTFLPTLYDNITIVVYKLSQNVDTLMRLEIIRVDIV